jgi:CheY-like chemotaxis protein
MAKVLAVDDDPDFCEALSRYLAALGHQVTRAGDGRAALKMLLHEEPDLILLDLKMPIMDGVAFVRVARSYIRFRATPILVMTGISDDAILEEMQDYGVSHIFEKAKFEFADIRRAIDATMQK